MNEEQTTVIIERYVDALQGHSAAEPIVRVLLAGAVNRLPREREPVLGRATAFLPATVSRHESFDIERRVAAIDYSPHGDGPCLFAPKCLVYHDVSATFDHRSPSLQRRMSRNAELLFWSNLPGRLLAVAILPHLAFLLQQGLWRLARGRLRPFLLGKYDAVRAWREVLTRRRHRAALPGKAHVRPHFALGTGSLRDARII